VSDTEIRIYNCYEKPKYFKPDIDFEVELEPYQIFKSTKTDKVNLEILTELFSQVGVDCGLIWTSNYGIREKVNIQERIDRYLVQSLVNTAKLLSADIKNKEIIHGLLMRSLFILYLEDKGAAKEAGLYDSIKNGAESYFDILEDIDATYLLFNELHNHFNGNIFPVIENEKKIVTQEHLRKIRACFTDGDISGNPKLFEWKVFNFNFIQIELLSEVYDNFLGELAAKKEKGQFYTPYPLVELILNDKLPTTKKEKKYDVKILDPACGSGIFLVESYKRLVRRWKNANPNKSISFVELRNILVDNIFGIEIDPLAIKVAAFSLYLALVEQLDPKTLWIDKNNRFPYLIDNPKDESLKGKEGKNLWCRDTIGEVDTKDFIKADLVVGNPPFGTKKLSKSIMDYCTKYNFGKEMVLPFLHKSVDFCPDGNIALIFNAKVLTNTEKPFQNFRKWLLNENYVEKIYNLSIFRKIPKDFCGQLFTSAVGPVCIVYFQKKQPGKISKTIEYWAPKTYIKSNLIDGVLIDSTDVKYLPRTECQIPDTKIWKIAMWGNIADFYLIKTLSESSNIKSFIQKKNITFGVGLQPLNKSTTKPVIDDEISNMQFIRPERIGKYFTPESLFSEINSLLRDKDTIAEYLKFYKKNNASDLPPINVFRRLGNKQVYQGPMLLIKEGFKNKEFCSSIINAKVAFNSTVLGLQSKNLDDLRVLSAILNSRFATYYLLMISSSWGIERERIKPNEVYMLPFQIEESNYNSIITLHKQIENIIENDFLLQQNKSQIEKEIERIILNSLEISPKDICLIEDFLDTSLDIFYKKEKSKTFYKVPLDENIAYAKMLHQELDEFYSETNHKINLTIYDVQRFDPLNLIVIHFCDSEKPLEIKNANELAPVLKELNKYSIQEKGKNIYVQKQFRYYDNDKIYLIKPNQKRFWTRSQAIDDAFSLIMEIANMGGIQ
jgi:type I restriction-modification system DNA methylase subunit